MKSMPQVRSSVEYSVAKNPYNNLYVDLTYRCNMNCNFCYNPLRNKFDMDPAYFEAVCQQLPGPVVFKLLGGEPTLHPQFFSFITTARRYGHHVYFSSNGIKYTDSRFMDKLGDLEVSYSPGLTMNGGYSRDDLYEIIDNRSCLKQKLAALDNLHKYGIKRVALSAIIVRDVNESVVGELLELADKYKDIIRYVHFRSAAKVSRWIDTEPLTTTELRELVLPYVSGQLTNVDTPLETTCGHTNGEDCCARLTQNRVLQIGLVEFASEKSAQCPVRGKLINDSFTIQPFFENMINTGELLAEDYGEVKLVDAI